MPEFETAYLDVTASNQLSEIRCPLFKETGDHDCCGPVTVPANQCKVGRHVEDSTIFRSQFVQHSWFDALVKIGLRSDGR